jgi:hypothetical protein
MLYIITTLLLKCRFFLIYVCHIKTQIFKVVNFFSNFAVNTNFTASQVFPFKSHCISLCSRNFCVKFLTFVLELCNERCNSFSEFDRITCRQKNDFLYFIMWNITHSFIYIHKIKRYAVLITAMMFGY